MFIYSETYLSLQVENSVISWDVENIQRVLSEKSKEPIHNIMNRINSHYVDSSRLIKRAFGDKFEDDFQQYNWVSNSMRVLNTLLICIYKSILILLTVFDIIGYSSCYGSWFGCR